MIILDEDDKKNISNMYPDAYKFCEFPSGLDQEEISAFMKTDENI